MSTKGYYTKYRVGVI